MFDQLGLSEEIMQAVAQNGYQTPTEIQAKCIPLILQGHDVVGRSVTGSGKTFAFGLPAIQMVDKAERRCQVLIICPTRELCLQVTGEIRKITGNMQHCATVPVYGGSGMEKQIQALKNGKIVVGTPGRLMDHLRRKTLKLDGLKLAVLDEADEMLDMGFREDIECILRQTPSARQTVMFSATMPGPIKAISRDYMQDPIYVEIGAPNATIDEIEQTYFRFSGKEKKYAIVELFRRLQPKRALIFCNTKRMVDSLLPIMTESGFDTLALHGDMRQNERKRVMDALKSHKSPYLIATDVAARGIDIEDVEYVFNYDMPADIEYYIHRIGRTGRAGKSGKAITFIGNQDELVLLSEVQRATHSDIREHELTEVIEDYVAFKTKSDPVRAQRPEDNRRKGGDGRRPGNNNRRPFRR